MMTARITACRSVFSLLHFSLGLCACDREEEKVISFSVFLVSWHSKDQQNALDKAKERILAVDGPACAEPSAEGL
ncbi:hypothetical protein [Pandoravirus japonicus]|uniref:Uncharacterized protein n=1 Tax=Pandoravirus japonicus TaxID=2823154 RepID=A0A811BQ31_9VIRU|nr:hypothetical protein [Pandoravirus japonicus]